MEIVFLGMNEAGEKALKWLNKREDVDVDAVIEKKENLKKIRKIRPDLVVSSGFEHKVPKEVIEIPEKGIVNLHPSLLPYNRGAHPYIWTLIEDTPAGVSMHFMNEEMDEGRIIAQKRVEKRPEDNAKSLRKRLMKAQADLFKENWEKILVSEAREQELEKGNVHYKKNLDEVSRLDLDKEMKMGDVLDLLRGLTYGNKKLAYFDEAGERYYVGLDIEKE